MEAVDDPGFKLPEPEDDDWDWEPTAGGFSTCADLAAAKPDAVDACMASLL